jgi:outer membrane protein insertion porin family
MKKLLRRYCVLLALLIYWVPAQAQVPPPLPTVRTVEVRHIGPPAVSDDLIRANIRLKVGEPYNRTSVDEDVRGLYNTGYFYNIRISEEVVEGGIKVIYTVQGKPRLEEIHFEGNKQKSTSAILKKVTSKVGQPLDERKLFADTQAIIKLYQLSGYQKTQVKYSLNINEPAGRGRVTFEITESPKVKITEVAFEGATAFTQKKLAGELKTKRRWMFSWLTGSGVLKDDELDEDKERLAEFYRNEGYVDFEIKETRIEQVDPKRIKVTFVVFEGRKYNVGTITFKGNSLFSAEAIRGGWEKGRGLKMTEGQTFTPRALETDLRAVRDFYGAKGYIDARVDALKNANTETGNIDLVYLVSEQDKSFIERIDIRGNIKTKDKVIRRELAVSPGEPFDMVRVNLSKQRIQNLNFFEKVDTVPEPTDVPNRKNLVLTVDEKNTGNFSLGAGFSSIDSLLGFLEVSQGNFDLFKPPYFTGAGQKGRLRLSYGARRQDYRLTFIEPWFMDRKLALGLEAYHSNSDYNTLLYDEVQTGARLSLERALWTDFFRGSLSYTIESVGIKNVATNASPELVAESGRSLVSKIGAGLAYDTRRGGLIPTGGQRTGLSGEFAGGPLGGENDFFKAELGTSWYFQGFREGHLLELGGRIGSIEPYGSSTNVTIYNRFFLGGPRTLRGFEYYGVGPRDSLAQPFGGKTFWTGSAEYSVPVIDRLRFAVFYDIGNVYTSSFSFNPNKSRGEAFYSDNYGIGIRLNLPFGPLRLDYGWPISKDAATGSGGRFNFDVGFTRDF